MSGPTIGSRESLQAALRMLDDLNADGTIQYDDYSTLHDLIGAIQAPAADDLANADHTESTCHICGGGNPSWHVDSDRWNTAFYRGTIACPSCFVAAHEAATGMRTSWTLVPSTPFRWIDDEGRPTPYLEARS